MSNTLDEFTYILPPERIAQYPATPRESANIMILDRKDQSIVHRNVGNFPEYLTSNDVLVINNTKVFKARLHATTPKGARVELFLIRPDENNTWIALGKPGKKIRIGDTLSIADNFHAHIIDKSSEGFLHVSFNLSTSDVIAAANTYGEIPIPPYIKHVPTDGSYQTVYASEVGSVAAPTAGFHLTEDMLKTIRQKGIQIIEITLHVGIGTFMPIKSESLETHTMHKEWVHITHDAAQEIMEAKKKGKRIIAIGTTTVRTLEGVAQLHGGNLTAYSGDIGIFITPGYIFTIVDALLTNFHLPKSTLLVLVSALAGASYIRRAYETAVEKQYRFYSFGDAMFIT